MVLALAAQQTTRIGLGPGVVVPSLRHPMVNAAETAALVALVALAPDRVQVPSEPESPAGRKPVSIPLSCSIVPLLTA